MISWKNLILLGAAALFLISCSKSRERTLSTPRESPEPARTEKTETESPAEEKDYRAGELMVKFKDFVAEERIEAITRELNLETIKIVSPPSLYLFRIRNGPSVPDLVERLEQFDEVEYAEPNYILKIF